MTPSPLHEQSKCSSPGRGTVARLKLKGIGARAPPGVELAAQFDSTQRNSPGQLFDSVGRGAWPFSVGGMGCLVCPFTNETFC